ncbi:heme exporter protein CcmD [Rhizobium sp. 9140]|uniref:heme exporter protein CcmD n=1 Tax=Rhizobium sp. 9140 TaxID=1761900 RepID=UPI00079263C1|nr:heme exporter protein CcmD [Rhizobium sp. 9140]CZT33429.1 heme exporter protein D [Rhizobium sp. 9140]
MSAHLGYVVASYGAALVAVATLIAWVVLDARARRRELRALEEAGIRRRSAGGGAP